MIEQKSFMRAVEYAHAGSHDPFGEIHGDLHWRAVASQGIQIARTYKLGSKGKAVAALFGLFHDCRRENDDYDPEHGLRGSQALLSYALDGIADIQDILTTSLIQHDNGLTTSDPFIGLGWDADRTLLTRVGMDPDISYFSVINENEFSSFIARGEAQTITPPTWVEIWQEAFEKTN